MARTALGVRHAPFQPIDDLFRATPKAGRTAEKKLTISYFFPEPGFAPGFAEMPGFAPGFADGAGFAPGFFVSM